ncbi:hypothetical protein KM914_06930 [Virgibacillus pantothenticus]|uniref:Cytoplasmic protein n=2 Tax=Virgibacillus pantothenticus TaxID=1473 RepID=A0A0L0QQ31_VIRPA|nr:MULTISPECIES: hypothetical protein [Virgibacillus]API90719.1 hypothetical protein BKP57_01880 [Virgibacillus sp. 6R]KNE20669.1 hypothetical protein AFK71_20205 [Virgibacillus pantothenticus]MBS7427681.1 hypothetical protein [Virgibacillus sp. 19R1-5]MBU8566169.1 hypothetical protein [Virgibacillus pantothenticus]MBU8600535.1 hypothetical protein [Virgibacillus pantothenticus]
MVDYKLRLIGQSRQCEPIQTDMIIAQGHHHFDASIEAREVNTTGSCIMNEMAQIKKLKSGGHLQMNQARLEHFHARGSIKARCIEAKNMKVLGIIRVKNLEVEYGEITMKGVCRINFINAVELQVRTGFSLSKRLIGEKITGKSIQLTNTEANIVRGEHVVLGENCKINTLYYKKQYTIANSANVKRIVKENLL